MGFATPLGLLALLAVPAILWIHLYRRRLQERRVAGLFLFPPEALVATAGRTRTRLLRSPSLWLELLAATFLGLLLGGLHLGLAERAPHLVVVLDDSASMSAAGTVERARARIEQELLALGRNALATLVRSGPRPEILAGPRARAPLVAPALSRWRPVQPRHDLGPALDLGVELTTLDDPLLLLTDDATAAVPPRCRRVAVGAARPNAALVGARRIRASAGEALSVDVAAFGQVRPTELRVAAREGEGDGERELLRQAVPFSTAGTARLLIPLGDPKATLRLSLTADELALDDELLLLPEPERPVTAAVLLPEATEALLSLKRALQSVPGVTVVGRPDGARLLFTPGPGRLLPWTTEVVLPPRDGERSDWIGPFLLERRHPLLSGVSLEGVVWSASGATLPGLPLVLAGNQPLLSEETAGDACRLWLDLDPARSNLSAAPDWPILVANLAERARRQAPGLERANLALGDAITWRCVGDEAQTLRLVTPEGVPLPARGTGVVDWEPRAPGLFRILRGEAEVSRVAVHFRDPHESDLTTTGSGDAPALVATTVGRDAQAAVAAGERELRWLLVLALACVLADWWVLRRGGRITATVEAAA